MSRNGRRGLGEERTPIDLFRLSVMLMILVAVWRVQDLFPILNKIKIQYLAPAFGLLVLLAGRDGRRALKGLKDPVFKMTMGVGAMVALSVPTSVWPGKSFGFLYNDHAKTLLLMVMIATSIRNINDVRRYLAVHIIGAVTYSYFVITTFQMVRGRLGDLVYYDANDLGLLLVCTLPFCVYFLRPGAKIQVRALATAAVGLLMLTVVKTGSRGAFLGFIACSAYLLFNFSAITKTVRIYAVGTMVALLLTFGGPRYWGMMSTMLTPTADNNWTGDTGRKEIWKRGIGYMLTHPVTGVGARGFGIAEGTISAISERQEYGIGLKWSAAHNSFVEVGAELGVIGLFCFVAALLHTWRFVRKIGHRGQAARAGPYGPVGHALGGTIVGYLISGFFVSAGYSAFLYTVFGMVIGMMRLVGPIEEGAVAPVGPAPQQRFARRSAMTTGRPAPGAAGRRSGVRAGMLHPGPAPLGPRPPLAGP